MFCEIIIILIPAHLFKKTWFNLRPGLAVPGVSLSEKERNIIIIIILLIIIVIMEKPAQYVPGLLQLKESTPLSAEEREKVDAELAEYSAAKKRLFHYAFKIRNLVNNPDLAGDISIDNKNLILRGVEERIEWFESGEKGDIDIITTKEFEEKLNSLELIVISIYPHLSQDADFDAPGPMPHWG